MLPPSKFKADISSFFFLQTFTALMRIIRNEVHTHHGNVTTDRLNEIPPNHLNVMASVSESDTEQWQQVRADS